MNDVKEFKQLLDEIKWLDADLSGKDFLLTWEKTIKEVQQVLYTAEALKWLHANNISAKCIDPGMAAMQSQDKSSRGRFSFISAARMLGLTVQDLDEDDFFAYEGTETVRETVNMISLLPLTDVIGIRGPLYLGAGNAYMRELAASLDEGVEKGILTQRPGIINLQCDTDHPGQAMADMLHLKHHFHSLERLAGKKITVTWVYSPGFQKPLSLTQGIIGLTTRFGMEVTLAHPEGYNLMPEVMEIASKNAKNSSGSFAVVHSMEQAFKDADVVYALSWDPYGVMEKRSALIRENDHSGLQELDRECQGQNANFKDWECTEEKLIQAGNSAALYLSDSSPHITSVSFRPYVIAAMILNNRFKEPARLLANLRKRNTKRVQEA
ncbi:MAG: knotted carbamoyltransferase YgeW [Candidatus Aminicenantes bacterium]|nr:knotted carbamoyltransferase YgeW [Candidatus Aminicenantes bacterium]NIM78026.1 knotted carbamoyltransferase YgeW [Candidatus Aminicenantes bacterium]NIN17346.1 knotted carbamoyltransferase YgeW [Candidatus Aminicenantes bacterium]NIN41239.1 knotted carbamoyltransferase YgeW [Candidatus Aminicenantes bacterium]NIN84012.1 knotted carbamoyltransferase YgeW [Candidatus Aminicenantes bacterium]